MIRGLRPPVRLLAVLLAAPLPMLSAQAIPPTDPVADYRRLRPLLTAGLWDSVTQPAPANEARRWSLRLLPAEVALFSNSARPWGTNDGAIWQGRGATIAASAGVALRWRWLSAQLQPVAFRAENRAFTLSPLPSNAGLDPFAYPSGIGQTLDMPQRFGDDAFTTVDLGQSFLRATVGPVAFGVSNENRWWGPGRRNGITMTNNAPGFGHAFVESARPVNIGIGTVEGEWLWGRLHESEYFDANPDNDQRFFTGIEGRFRPKGLSDLTLGFTRYFSIYWPEGGIGLDEALMVFIPLEKADLITPENPTGDDAADQMASLFFRWAFPEAGLELYGEWGRGDHSRDFRDLFVEPEHASAWLLGFQKAFTPAEGRFWRFSAEFLTLGGARTTQLRPPASAFYEHHIVTQGFTQRGQVMGAGIGPGSSQVWFGLDRFARWGKVGGGFLRTVYDNNRFYAEPRSHHRHEVEPSFGVDALVFRGPLDLTASVTRSRLLNKWYVERNDETNVNLSVGVRYHFDRR